MESMVRLRYFCPGAGHHIEVLEQTCFGTHLSALARLPGPIRELKGTEDLLSEPQALNSSREFTRLIGWLMSHDVETMVRSSVITCSGAPDMTSFSTICSLLLGTKSWRHRYARFVGDIAPGADPSNAHIAEFGHGRRFSSVPYARGTAHG